VQVNFCQTENLRLKRLEHKQSLKQLVGCSFFALPPKQIKHNCKKNAGYNCSKKISVRKIPFNHVSTPFNSESDQRSVMVVIKIPSAAKAVDSNNEIGFVKKGEIIPAVNHAAASMLAKSESAFN
jgi:hypothetical protein